MKFSTLTFICLTFIVFGLVFIAFGKFLKLNDSINGKDPGDRALIIGVLLEFIGMILSLILISKKNK